MTPPKIITNLQRQYGKPGHQDIELNLTHILKLMDRNQPTKVMVHLIEEVQIFLLASPEEGHQLTEINLIIHVLIKLSETGGIYAKPLENWNQ